MLKCAACSKSDKVLTCTACKSIYYCGPEHQKSDWSKHKIICPKVKDAKVKGVIKQIVAQGDNTNYPKKGDIVTVHYTGKFVDGKVFDSSKEPFKFTIGAREVIRGWDEGVPLLSLGEKATLFLSSDYAYGSGGVQGAIPPNAPLIFDVELLKIN
eukprot:TRINITY_DN6306_c0_g1_i1.p1 TRINITY_DN6306_c0_g1~~TRINITY_DN6306_c0_g1_i1.p1  ORF type:complete len:155 (-),score=23.66 TRINITY_DN6306_c0_g1_i1:38-502(-)